MLIRLESKLKQIKEDLEDNIPKEEIPMRGTLAVIHGEMDFSVTDGYIRFLKLALNNIRETYGEQKEEWQLQIERILNLADKLRDDNVRFTGSTKDDFTAYCGKISGIISAPVSSLTRPGLAKASGDIVSFMEEQVNKGNKLGFYYEESEDAKAGLMDDLMEQLSRLKINKSGRKLDVSYFLYPPGYHEHIIDALNLLVQAAVYVINCKSTRECDAYCFDVMEVSSRLNVIENIIGNTAHLI